MNIFAQELKKYRNTQHLTIQEFAKKIGCSSAVTFYYETGERCPPFKKMLAIFKKLGISPHILIPPQSVSITTPINEQANPNSIIISLPSPPEELSTKNSMAESPCEGNI